MKVGQKAQLQLSYYPGKTYTGRIAYIYPSLDADTHTAKARIEIPNPNFELTQTFSLPDAQLPDGQTGRSSAGGGAEFPQLPRSRIRSACGRQFRAAQVDARANCRGLGGW